MAFKLLDHIVLTYTQTHSKFGFPQSQSSRDSTIVNRSILDNIDRFTIVESRDFGKAEIPNFECVWVFIPVALLLFGLAYVRNSSKPLAAAGILFIAYAFDVFVRNSFHDHKWNWEGGILSFLWPWVVIYFCFSAEEIGLKLQKPVKGILYGVIFGLILGGWNLYQGPPTDNSMETIAYQLFVPPLSEELVFRGLFFAILVHYLSSYGWAITLVSLLFINVHLITADRATFVNLLGNVTVATVALGYLRVKTDSIWPCVICHSLINSMPNIK